MSQAGLTSLSTDDALLMQAESLIQIGRFRDALTLVEQLLVEQPDRYRAWVYKGEILRRMHNTKEAIEAFQHAMEMDPYDDWVIARCAEAYRDHGDTEQALSHVDRALALNPDSVFGLAVKGELVRALGQIRESVRLLDRSHALNVTHAVKYAEQAEALREEQHHEEALYCYDNSLTANAHSAWVLARKGEALRTLGELEAAMETIDQALELRDRYLALLGAKGEMLRKMARFEDALACFDRARERHQEKSRMIASKAMALHDLGQTAMAEELLRDAIKHQPADSFLWWLLAQVLDRGEHVEAAAACLAKVIELNPSHTEAIATYARLLWQMEDFEQARQMLRRYLALRRDDWGFFLAALIELRDGSPSAATTLLERAISTIEVQLQHEVDEKVRSLRQFNLALYFLVVGDVVKARELYHAAIDGSTSQQMRDALHDLRVLSKWKPLKEQFEPVVAELEATLGASSEK
jgi:tetratricopeptide (TPR) repeat protein